MPHNPSPINAWSTAQQFNSNEFLTSTQYSQLVNNVSLMYARPYITVTNTTAQTLATNAAIFTGGSPTTITNSPSTSAGSITFSASTLTVPLTGLYRLTMNISVGANATAGLYTMVATLAGGATANNHVFYTNRQPTSTTSTTFSNGSFLIPMQQGGGTYPNTVSFTFLANASQTVQGQALPLGVNSTFVQLEYLGASNGSI